MFTHRDILLGLMLPAAITVAALLVARFLFREKAWPEPLVIGAAFAAGYYALVRPPWPPIDPVDWLCYLAPGLAILGALDDVTSGTTTSRAPFLVRLFLVGAVAGALTWLLGRPLLESKWESNGAIWMIGIALVMTVVWAMLDLLTARVHDASLACALFIVVASTAATATMSAGQLIGQIAGALAAAIAALVGFNVLFRGVPLSRGGAIVVTLLWVSLLVCASVHAYAEMPVTHSLLLLTAPMLAWGGELPPLRNRGALARGVARVLAVSIPCVIALMLAGIELRRAMRESGELGW